MVRRKALTIWIQGQRRNVSHLTAEALTLSASLARGAATHVRAVGSVPQPALCLTAEQRQPQVAGTAGANEDLGEFWAYGKAGFQHAPGSCDQSTSFSFTELELSKFRQPGFSSERLSRSQSKLRASQEDGLQSNPRPPLKGAVWEGGIARPQQTPGLSRGQGQSLLRRLLCKASFPPCPKLQRHFTHLPLDGTWYLATMPLSRLFFLPPRVETITGMGRPGRSKNKTGPSSVRFSLPRVYS